ncbi:MAG TPA: hypothetical protein VFD91_13630 [Mariniphaga sp.]|nr:hypothetical protein [Mariniphaga sp.]
MTTSVTNAETILYPPGECSPQPLAAKPPNSKPGLPETIRYKIAAPAILPKTCATMYGNKSFPLKRFPAYSPIDTARFK